MACVLLRSSAVRVHAEDQLAPQKTNKQTNKNQAHTHKTNNPDRIFLVTLLHRKENCANKGDEKNQNKQKVKKNATPPPKQNKTKTKQQQ